MHFFVCVCVAVGCLVCFWVLLVVLWHKYVVLVFSHVSALCVAVFWRGKCGVDCVFSFCGLLAKIAKSAGSLVRKKNMAAAIRLIAQKVRTKPVHPIEQVLPAYSGAQTQSGVIKMLFIDIIVPRDSGACSRTKLVPAGIPKP